MGKEIRTAYTTGTAGKIVAARLLPGTDLIQGIVSILKEKDIKNGWVEVIGSLEEATYFILEKKDTSKVKLGAGYGDPIHVDGPVELFGAWGLIVDQGIHIHAAMCDDTGRCFGGHLIEGGNPSLATLEVFITEVLDANFARKEDLEIGGNHFAPFDK